MEPKPPPSAGRVIWREGLIFGVILGIVDIGVLLLTLLPLGVLVFLLSILLWLGVFFWVGARSAKQTGRVGIGSLTGLITAVFAGIIAFIGWLVIYTPVFSQQIVDSLVSQNRSVPPNLTGGALIVLIVGGIILWALGIGAGAGVGALGGLLGRSQSTVVPPIGPANPGYGPPPMQAPYPPPYVPQYPQYPPPYQNQPPQWPQQ